MRRRDLLRFALVSTTGLPLLRLRAKAAADTELPAESLATLKELAFVVLPPSLGRRRTDALATGFARWVREYREGAALEHGYGNPRLRVAPASPASAYISQLKALDSAARAGGRPFSRLPAEAQRTIVENALRAAGVDQLPRRPTGEHVITDLMAWYFQSSEANDYVYQAEIGRQKCRPVEQSTRKPRRLSL